VTGPVGLGHGRAGAIGVPRRLSRLASHPRPAGRPSAAKPSLYPATEALTGPLVVSARRPAGSPGVPSTGSAAGARGYLGDALTNGGRVTWTEPGRPRTSTVSAVPGSALAAST
jgi:hypothetical protein